MDKSKKKMKQDLVSIIITTCNRCDILPRAINSALNQTYKNIEIIVVDDCSTDLTDKIIKTYQEKDSRIIYIKNDIQSGANVSRNKGIQVSHGQFITGLDDDDEFMPNRIELLLSNYDEKYAFITSNNIIFEEIQYISSVNSIVKLEDMLYQNIIDNQALVDKNRIISVGGYDETLCACQDYDLWIRLILKYGDVKVLQEATQIIYRNHNYLRISSKSRKKFKGYFHFYKKYKFLMNKLQRKEHIHRLYSIRDLTHRKNALTIKFLVYQLNHSGINSFSIFGAGELMKDLYDDILKSSFTINYLTESNPTNNKNIFTKHVITPFEAIQNGERNFLIASAKFTQEMLEHLHNLERSLNIKLTIIYY